MNSQVTQELVEKYLDLTSRAKGKATPIHGEDTAEAKQLSDMMGMCDDYASDARHFMETGDLVRAFGAIELYNTLGRHEDVRRILAIKEAG